MPEKAVIDAVVGKPYSDERWPGGPQIIPGRVMCAYYDLGGEGVAYHDSDAVNHGSGELNPLDGSYLHHFRVHEGVDTSYVKFRDEIDNNPYNFVSPEENMLYVGWTVPGEWLNYTISVIASGVYTVSLMYTSYEGGIIALDIDQKEAALCEIASTATSADIVPWRQWHHWNKSPVAEFALTEGIHLLTLRTVEKGNMNYAYLEFAGK
jgi:hypothetical protein